ncbi:rhomboid family intramembrane serine protease [Aurantibacillus circumpalustris]|uniref:rhomboid family intramembrane serine protease n=1 Tax=Aurantibacillus circumpalustris TaxID=3036359 RepID=UPI00295A5D9B|nr:rhomboid family intramembrane serine protease [Aurantibacillus circumpalustris]
MNFNNQYRPGGFGGLPVVTKNIIIINVILYLATVLAESRGIDLVKYLGLHYFTAPDFRPHQFVTYIFMHGSLMHIFFNMFGVYIFGQVLEQVWGPKRYLIFYILTGFGAALAQYIVIYFSVSDLVQSIDLVQTNLSDKTFTELFNSRDFSARISREFIPDYESFVNQYNAALNDGSPRAMALASQFLLDYKHQFLNSQVIIGASGSLFGLLGAFGMLFPNRELYLYFFIPVKAKWLVIGYGAIELFSGWKNDPLDNVAHFAHIGGLVIGVILVLIWRRDRNNFY